MPRVFDNSRLHGNKMIEEQEKALEFERRRLSDFQLAPKLLPQAHLVNPMEDLRFAEGPV